MGQFWSLLDRTGLFVPVTFLLFMFWRAPHLDPQDWDYDEGINLMKAMLLGRGFTLYREIWSDQPPFLTALLVGWTQLFGETVASTRILIMLFAALLLWALYLAMRASVSAAAAIVALLLLLISEYFLRLSGAVMIGLPALALATTAAAMLVTGRQPLGWLRIAAAAIVLAFALQTKLIVALMGPALGAYFLFGPSGAGSVSWRKRILQALFFGMVAFGTFVLIALPFNALQPEQLIGTHFGAQTWQQTLFLAERSEFLPNFFRQHWVYLIVAGIGVATGWRRQWRDLLFPLVWFVTTLLALTVHRPLWYHHVILLTVPLCWLCAYGVETWVRFFRALGDDPRNLQPRVAFLVGSAVLLALAVTMLPVSLEHRQEDQMRVNRPNYIPHIMERFTEDAAQTPAWVFTDHPFYAFQAGLPVPPPIAAISRKRIETGIITQEAMVQVLNDYAPRYVILERFTHSYSEPFMQIINERYDLVTEIEPGRYYRLKAGYDFPQPPPN